MTSKIVYQGELHTEATHLRSGNQIVTDAPVDNNGKGEAFSPTDLVATALGSCMVSIMGIKSNQMNLDITGTTVEITKIMASEPRRISEVQVLITLPHSNFTDKERKILEKAAIHCPVAKSLHPDLVQKVEFTYTN